MSMNNFILKISVVVAIAMLPLLGISSNSIFYHASYSNSNLVISTDTLDGVVYSTVAYDNMYNDGAPGMPSLPVEYIRFSVPWNATNFTVSSLPRNWINNNLTHMLYPCQVPQMTDGSMPPEVTLPDSAAYFSGESYPSQMAWVAHEGFLDGENHIVTVALMPFSYLHSSTADVIRTARTLHVTLSYDLSDSLAMYPIVRNDSALREVGHRMAQSIVVNPNQVLTFSPTSNDSGIDTLIINPHATSGYDLNGHGAGDVGPVGPLQPQDSILNPNPEENYELPTRFTYLIVTTSDLIHSVRRIAALKNQKGYNVKVATLDEVISDPTVNMGDVINGQVTFTDNAGILRQYLRKHYCNNGTRFVLLVGDNMPFRYRQFHDVDAPADLYFSDLNSDWSTDKLDKAPELYVGRILASDGDQIINYTDKLLRYELNPGNGDLSYLQKALYTEGYDMHLKNEVKSLTRQSNAIFPDSCVMEEDISGVTKYPSGADIVNEINSHHYGYLSLHNHAFPSGFLTYGFRKDNAVPDDVYRFLWAIDTVRVTTQTDYYHYDLPSGNGLNCLSNRWYPNICYSVACNTMPFDTIKGFAHIPQNLGKSFTVGKNYGGPAFLGNTREGYIYKSSLLEATFFAQIIKGIYKVGQIEALSKLNFTNDKVIHKDGSKDNCYFSCVHNLLGDPEFEVWTNIPQRYEDITITRGENSITIDGVEPNKTIIAQCGNYKPPRYQRADSTSITLTNTPSNCTIMLYAHNMIPYILPMVLQNTVLKSSQYVIAGDFLAGSTVDCNRTSGEVVVKKGVKYEIESSGVVRLEGGFKVKKGATFAVYPACF